MATKFITVSIDIMHDKNLSPNQKFILAEIYQLSQLDKGCVASNRHFSELVGITTMGVSKSINDLSLKGYISIENAQTKRNFGRVITINSGKSDINSGKSDINSGLQSKENKTMNKTINNIYKKNLGISDRVELWKIEAQKEILPIYDQLPIFEKFISYWTSHNSSDLKFTAEKQKTFIYKQRFATWLSNHKKWDNQKTKKTEINNAWDYLEQVHKEETDKKFNKKHNEVITNG